MNNNMFNRFSYLLSLPINIIFFFEMQDKDDNDSHSLIIQLIIVVLLIHFNLIFNILLL